MAMPITRRWILIPLLGSLETKGAFRKLVAEAAGCQPEEILGSDLFLYNREKAKHLGAGKREYLSARALDDLQCAWATMEGFLQAKEGKSIPVCCIFDNEEVGSNTQQGARFHPPVGYPFADLRRPGDGLPGGSGPTALWSLRTMPMPSIPIIRSMPIRTTGL